MYKCLFLFALLLPLLSAAQSGGPFYVNAPSGLNVRSLPYLDEPVVMKLPYGRHVTILDSTGEFLTLKENGKAIKGEWLRVEYGIYPEDTRYAEAPTVGYVWGAYVAPVILQVPTQSLYYLNDMRFVDVQEEPDRTSYEIQGGTFTQHFDPREEEPSLIVYEQAERMTYSLSLQQLRDSMDRYVELSWVEEKEIAALRANRIRHPYEIDTTPVQIDLTPAGSYQNDFLLLLDGGKDTLRIQDEEREWTTSHRFVGRIHSLNSYVVNAAFESSSHYFVDMTTGEKTWTTEGLPLISPDGKVAVDTYQFVGESGVLAIVPVEKGVKQKQYVICEFQSWEPRETVGSAFWISNRELVMQIQPIIFNSWNMNPVNYGTKPVYRWVKVKVNWVGN